MPFGTWRLRQVGLYAAELVICGIVSLPLGSCTILLPANAIRNNRRFPPGPIEVLDAKRLPGKPRIAVVTAAGDTLRGVFLGLQPVKSETYRPRYEAWHAGRTDVPDLDEKITLVMNKGKGKDRTGRFTGFGISSVSSAFVVSSAGASVWMTVGKHDEREIPLAEVSILRMASGLELRSDSLRAHAIELPLRRELSLHFEKGIPPEAEAYWKNHWTARIPLSDIRYLEILSPVASPVLAFFGGAILDGVLVLGVAAAAMSSSSSYSSGCSPSYYGSSYASREPDSTAALPLAGSRVAPHAAPAH